MKTLILDKKSIMNLVDMKKSIEAVEDAFREYGKGRVQMPAKIYLHLDKFSGDFRAMPAYVEKLEICSLKWVNVHPCNKMFGLPAVMGIIILSNPRNGFPLCIMDGTYATSLRTGAAGGVAARYLARKDSRVVGMVGCGAQARAQLEALLQLFDIAEVKVWGHEHPNTRGFIKDMNPAPQRRGGMKKGNFKLIDAGSIKECVKDCDIVVTTTPSRKALVKLGWLKKGAHINAMGADARGKQELDPAILKRAKVIVDSWEQASHSGEINVPFKKKLISQKDIYADIGEIVTGKKRGRVSKDELTVFDSTGLAVQDVAISCLIYKLALKKKIGKWIEIV